MVNSNMDYNSYTKEQLIAIIQDFEKKLYRIEVKTLGERLKELECIYGISEVIESYDRPLGETLKSVVLLIPPGFQYPEITCARIQYMGHTYTTPNFQETKWKYTHSLNIFGMQKGEIAIFYLDQRPDEIHGPFLKEEISLIKAIAERVQRLIERVETNENLKKTAYEKEILLRELHHRVKNNLQVISGLITLQINSLKDNENKDIFIDLQNRIKTIAFTHDLLHRSEKLENIDVPSYFDLIISNVFQTFQSRKGHFTYNCVVGEVALELDAIMNCGLIINELVTNALKHAFIGRDSGHISVRFEKYNHEYILIVQDDGMGFDFKFDEPRSKTLGLSLIKMLVKKLRGHVQQINEKGTTIKITWNA